MLRTRLHTNRHSRIRGLILAIACVAVVFTGCSEEPRRQVLVWTDVPALLDYAILFNQDSDTYAVEVASRPDLIGALQSETRVPDLVIGRYLNQAVAEQLFDEAGTIVSRAGGPQQFYPGFLAMGRFGNVQRLVPVSFDVPAVLFADALSPDPEHRLMLELDAIRSAAGAFNDAGPAGTGVLGYSPLWDTEFLRTLTTSRGVAFRHGPAGGTLWSTEPLRETLSFAAEWVFEVNEGPEQSDAFAVRYLTRPHRDLVRDGRIGFAFVSGSEFLGWPDSQTVGLHARWVAHDGVIFVRDSVVMAGVPRETSNAQGARAFLNWLLSDDTQQHLIEQARDSGHARHGIAGGFSSIIHINERVLLEARPDLVGRIPPVSVLRWPQRLPHMWPRMRDEAVIPWVRDQIRAGNSSESPETRIQNWLRQQEPVNRPDSSRNR